MTTAPRVSIGMPVYNSKREYFFESLHMVLGQTFGDFELLISDNGSGPEARAMYDEAAGLDPRVRCVHHPVNLGVPFNFSYCFSETRGAYFMWTADDDLRTPDYLRRTVERLDRNPRAVSAGTSGAFIDERGQRHGSEVRFDPLFADPRALARVPLRGPLTLGDGWDVYALHRRAALARTHLYPEMYGAEYLLVRELLLQGPIERVEEEYFLYRTRTAAAYTRQLLVDQLLGSQPRKLLFRYPSQYLALQMLVSVATNDVPIADSERRACVVALGLSLVRQGLLTQDRYMALRARASEEQAAGRYGAAALSLVEAFATAPGRLLDVSAWRRLLASRARPSGRPEGT